MTKIFFALIFALSLFAFNTAEAQDASGTWLRETGTAKIKITACGSAMCGKVVWLRNPNGPDGKPLKDDKNPDAAKRSNPMIGTNIILGMRPSGAPGEWKGQVYKADEGKVYSGKMKLLNRNSLKLSGCVLGGLICRSETWTRMR